MCQGAFPSLLVGEGGEKPPRGLTQPHSPKSRETPRSAFFVFLSPRDRVQLVFSELNTNPVSSFG
jgi:hypothetical protein